MFKRPKKYSEICWAFDFPLRQMNFNSVNTVRYQEFTIRMIVADGAAVDDDFVVSIGAIDTVCCQPNIILT